MIKHYFYLIIIKYNVKDIRIINIGFKNISVYLLQQK